MQNLVLCTLIAAATFAVYFPILKHPFVNYDDVDYVTENRHVQQGLTIETLRWALSSTQYYNWHPLTWISHAADVELFGMDAGGHHFTSLLFHAVNGVLIFLLLAMITGKKYRSLVVAALFALHPINVESVAWVAERKTVLSMMFLLLTLFAYVWYARKPGWRRQIAVITLFILSLAAKPMVVTLPFALLLLDYWPLQRIRHWVAPSQVFSLPQFPPLQLLKEKIPLFLLSCASCVITVVAQHKALKTIKAIPFGARVVNAIFSYGMYLAKTFWPARFSVFYAPQGSRLAAWQIAACLAFLAGLTVLAWRQRSRPYLLVGWLWYLGTLVPMIGIVQVGEQGMADRYAYLPLVGILIALVWGAADLAAAQIDTRLTATATVAVLLALSWQTRRQLPAWESSYALWSHSLAITPENYVAEDFVGTTLMQDLYKSTGQTCAAEALVHFQRAVQINPEDTLGLLNVGFCAQEHGDFQYAAGQYQLALSSARNRFLKSRAYLNLGAVYDAMQDFQRSREYYNAALQLYPLDPEILGHMRGMENDEKIAQLEKTAQPHPTAEQYLEIGRLEHQAGRDSDARASYQRALNLDPHSADALKGLHELPSGQQK
ncbi:MAG TPA: tetratricopeptide repeat protein [Candidatus Binatia bacterium]|nr:tetratricopeptide repeat protein [Candidatus Binatia bacterium]